MSRELDLKTLEFCRAHIEQVGRELLERERPKVARELRDLCRLLRSRVIKSHEFSDIIEPLDQIADAATLIEQQRKSNDACPKIATGVAKLGNDLNRLSRRRSVALEDVFHGLIGMPDGDNRCGVFFAVVAL